MRRSAWPFCIGPPTFAIIFFSPRSNSYTAYADSASCKSWAEWRISIRCSTSAFCKAVRVDSWSVPQPRCQPRILRVNTFIAARHQRHVPAAILVMFATQTSLGCETGQETIHHSLPLVIILGTIHTMLTYAWPATINMKLNLCHYWILHAGTCASGFNPAPNLPNAAAV